MKTLPALSRAGLFSLFLLLPAFLKPAGAQTLSGGGGEANPSLRTNAAALRQWQSARFGLFMHWGPISLRGTEIGWSRGKEVPVDDYDSLYREFDPVLFNAAAIVKLARDAGMKYLVFVTKHHDGFCMWNTAFSSYNIMAGPFHRDVLREIADACNQQGLEFGTYYSIPDWHHPDYTTRHGTDTRLVDSTLMPSYIRYMKSQLKELIRDYHTRILWFDGEWERSWTHRDGMDLYTYVRSLQDDLLVNNRVDKGWEGIKGPIPEGRFAGDYRTPEQEIGAFDIQHPWETCMTLCEQWSWKPNDKMKSLKECIQALARTAGGGGNLLLNVGPMPDGRIEKRQRDRLLEIGLWLQKYGESIYGTRGGPYKPGEIMASTRNGNKVYLHLFAWTEGKLTLPALAERKVLSASLLRGERLKCTVIHDSLVLDLPNIAHDPDDAVIVLELDGDAETILPVPGK